MGRFINFLVLLVLISVNVYSQNSYNEIRGRIFRYRNSAALSEFKVELKKDGFYYKTYYPSKRCDDFTIENLPNGNYLIMIIVKTNLDTILLDTYLHNGEQYVFTLDFCNSPLSTFCNVIEEKNPFLLEPDETQQTIYADDLIKYRQWLLPGFAF